MNIDKMAKQDAFNWARAEMFFGAGAGTRRKLLNAEIEDKVAKIPGYIEHFNKWYEQQNFADHAIAAAKERKRIDRMATLRKNGKGLLTGNRRQLTGAVLTGVFVYGVLVETGLDKPLKENVKKTYDKSKAAFMNAVSGVKKED